MWHLDLRKYSSVIVKKTALLPLIVPASEVPRFKENAGLMSWLKDHFNQKKVSPVHILGRPL
jgi:hypothetical protein